MAAVTWAAFWYRGSLEQGHDVQVIDTQWFGNHLQAHSALTVIEGDIRGIQLTLFTDIDAVILWPISQTTRA